MRHQCGPVPTRLGSVAAHYQFSCPAYLAAAGLPAAFARHLAAEEPTRRMPTRTQSGRDARLQRLEAVLFLAREPLSSRKLGQFAQLADATEARALIRRLNDVYVASGRAFRVEEVAGGYLLLTCPQFGRWVRRLHHVPREERLSAPALETLAVVAYRQPTARAEIEAIRGVNCGEILRQLMERDLVRIQGRSEELGRPYLYATTPRFLRLFGLKSLDKLPRVVEVGKEEVEYVAEPNRNDGRGAGPSPGCANEEETDVTVTSVLELSAEQRRRDALTGPVCETPAIVMEDEDDLEDDELDDDDDDLDDDEEDDDDLDDEEDDDFEDDDWEEVEDDEEDDDFDDDDEDDDLDWEDDDEDDDDEEEEEEEAEAWE